MTLVVTLTTARETRDPKGLLLAATIRLHAVDTDTGAQADWEYTLQPIEVVEDYSAIVTRETKNLLKEIDAILGPPADFEHKAALTISVDAAGTPTTTFDPAVKPIPIPKTDGAIPAEPAEPVVP